MNVRFERRQELAPHIWEYHFQPERSVDFTPGQYADFHLLQALDDPRGQSRTFSLTSLPGDPLVSFVARFDKPLSPYKQALEHLQPGDELRVDDAMGDVVLPKLPAIPLVFVGGGIGIASFISIFKHMLAKREERQVFLFYTLRRRTDYIYRETISSYPLQLNSTTIAPHRLQANEIIDSTPPNALLYLSGSQRFVEGLRADLQVLGIPHERIVFDYFDGYAEL